MRQEIAFRYDHPKTLMKVPVMLSRRGEISVRRVRSLLTVLELNSFTQAAEELGLTQPAISQHVTQLEKQLGFTLLVRDREGLRLSPAGSSLLPGLRRLVAGNEAIVDQLASLSLGTEQILRVASVASFAAMFIGPAFHALRPRFPNHVLDIVEIDSEETFQLVRSNEIDFGISSVFVPSPGLLFELLCQDGACVVLSTSHPLAARSELADEEVLAEPFIRFPSGTTSGNWLAMMSERSGLQPRTVVEVRQLMTGCQLAQQNIGLTVVPEIAARSCPLPGLAVVPLRDGLPPRKLGVVTSEFHQPSQFENAVLSKLREMTWPLRSI
ncbi:LysR family transcriptional regulator [Mesorhizobium sp. B3-1-3]|nr:LysR family transcriptional regulator [Mesorhizobium sp. B3-1-3]TPI68568.1 LysR family transcriptional regulator [Mesorhizobium sp. B3-1-8]